MGSVKAKALMQRNGSLGVMLISADDAGNMVVWSNKRFASLVVAQ